MKESERCDALAADQTIAADEASLANVRDRSTRAAAAWTQMADRARRVEALAAERK